MIKNPIVERYGDRKIWVSWKPVTRDGRVTKVPIQIDGSPASSTDESTWSTFNEIASDKVGIVFSSEKKLVGLDIDKVIVDRKIVGEHQLMIAELIMAANTYVEYSPSKSGLHLLFDVSEPFETVSNRRAPFELYSSGRYFTFTGDVYGEGNDIRTVTAKELNDILSVINYPWIKEVSESIAHEKRELFIADEDILERMCRSKVKGKAMQALLAGDTTKYANDDSRADMALVQNLAYWTGRDAEQMERIWLKSDLGQREKTQTRADYRKRTIDTAIAQCKSIYIPKSESIEKDNADLELMYVIDAKKDKVYIQNTENMCRILRKHADFKGRFRYDEFTNVYEYMPYKAWRPLEDNDAVNIQASISILFPQYFGKVGKDMIYDAIIKVAKENAIDSAKLFITSLIWDKKNRVDEWLFRTYGCEKNVYHTAVAANWLKGLVKRIIEPGCQFDYVLVIEGPQGVRKSTSLAVLGGPQNWHVETNMSTDSKDFFMQFQGKAIIEFSEGETMNRTEVKKMKAIITTRSDRYRLPYERTTKDFPRRCVFAMTTNQEEYLKDETGNRRYLPIKVVHAMADVEWLERNREQLFAECYHRLYVNKELIYEFPKEETLSEQNKRKIHDENVDPIISWYFHKLTRADRANGVTIQQAFRDAVNGGFSTKMQKYEEMKICAVFKDDLGLDKVRKSVRGIQLNRWVPSERTLEMGKNLEDGDNEIYGSWEPQPDITKSKVLQHGKN